jgi:anti-sigma B factor antagonist
MQVEIAERRGIPVMSDEVTSTGGLGIAVNHGDGAALVRLSGRVDIDTSPGLRDQLLALLQSERPEAITVDFTDVPYVDGSGIATLIEGLKIARNRNTTVRLSGLHGRLHHLLEATGVLSLFEPSSETSNANAQSVSKVN